MKTTMKSQVGMLCLCLTILTGSVHAADIVIKPFGTVASTEYSTSYEALDTIADANGSIDTGDPIPAPWPTLSVNKHASWINKSAEATADAWIAYDLGAYYTITGAHFWRYGSANSNRLLKDHHILFAESLSGDFTSAALDTNDFSGAVTPTPLELWSLSTDPGTNRTFNSPGGMAVRYVLIDIDSNWGDGNYVGLGEIRFTGTEATDTYPPELAASSPFYPPDDELSVATETALVATFNEPVTPNSGGSITITDLTDGSSTETITLPDATRVTASGADLTIQPPVAGFEGLTEYSVRISTNAVKDGAAPPNIFAGITNDTTWTFTTVDADRFVIEPTNAAASSEFSGRPAMDAINSHGVDDTIIETGDPIPYPWPTASTSKTESWMTLNVGASEISNQWITLDLGDVYSLDGVYVWNYRDNGNGNNGIEDLSILFATNLTDTFGSGTSVSNDYSGSISKTFAKATTPHEGEFVGFDAPVTAQYVLFDITSNHGSTYVGISELRFTGKTYSAPPAIASLDPVNGTTVVTPASLTASFNEEITTNSIGNITITNLTVGGAADIIPVGSSELSVSSSNLVITPISPTLSDNNTYAVLIATNAIKSTSSGHFYAGITDTNGWQFSTESGAVAPQIQTLSPFAGATGVALDANMEATFDQNIYTNTTGSIVITNLTQNSIFATIAIGDTSQITVSGTNLIINPAGDLADDIQYAVLIDTSALKNLADTFFEGITNASDWSFTTAKDTTAPAIDTLSPIAGATKIATNVVLQATFDQSIALTGAGTITITDLTDGSDNRTINLSDSQVTLSSPVLTIDPTTDFEKKTEYEVTISSGVVEDTATSPNAYGGTTSGQWTFTTLNPDLFVIKPVDAEASVEYSGREAPDTFNYVNASIDTGEPIPSPWPTVGVGKTDNWLALDGPIVPSDQWITLDLGTVYSLEGLHVWNYWDVGSGPQQGADAVSVSFATSLSDTFGSTASVASDFSDPISTNFVIATSNPEAGARVDFSASVDARYVLIEVSSTHGASDRVGIGELRFIGDLPADTFAPTLDTTAPPDNDVYVSTNTALVATFNEDIALSGGGSITLTDLTDGSSTETISLPDATRVTASGRDVTIQPPAASFEGLTEYAVRISNDAVQDLAATPNLFGGITDDTTWTFTIVNSDRFVIEPTNAAASSEFAGRPAIDAINSHGVDATIIETEDPIPYPWPTATTSKTESWMTLSVGASEISNQWITLDLGEIYDLDGVYLWNYKDGGNGNNGIKDLDILFATNLKDTFGSGTSVSNDYSGSISKTFAKATIPHEGEFVAFDSLIAARYVLFDITSNHGSTYVGLSELRFTGKTFIPPTTFIFK